MFVSHTEVWTQSTLLGFTCSHATLLSFDEDLQYRAKYLVTDQKENSPWYYRNSHVMFYCPALETINSNPLIGEPEV